MKRILATFLVLIAALAVVAALRNSAERRDLNFSHAFHVEEQGLSCDVCHPAAARSTTGHDDLLPRHPQCADCHDVESPNDCAMCHLSAPQKLSPRVQDYSPRFSHTTHVTAGLQCTECHGSLDELPPLEKVGHFPNMAECMSCHEQRNATLRCADCHEPHDPRRPVDHLVNWLNRHGAAASSEEDGQCNQCHGRENIVSCQGCHTGDQVFFPHPRNYISRHGQDAHLSDLSCVTCHDRQNDCNACHRQLGVIPAGHFRAGWATRDGGRHAEQARFELEACMSCHDGPRTEPTCARCHGK